MEQLTIFDVFDEKASESVKEESARKFKHPEAKYLTEEHFDETRTNPTFVAYLYSVGKRVGDEYRLSDCQKWVDIKVREFKKVNGVKEHDMFISIENAYVKFAEFVKVT